MSPIVRNCASRGVDFFILHTGQHYTYNMDMLFFEELSLPAPDYNVMVGSGSFASQMGKIMIGLEEVLTKEEASYVLGEGDTNSVLGAALVASHLHIPFVHVEAGLRSYNRLMQEEHNRIIADRVADLLFPPTPLSRDILIQEGYERSRIYVTGNTIVDALRHYLPAAIEASSPEKFGVEPQKYFLATVHRAENTDCSLSMGRILEGLERASREHGLPVVFPIHPRTRSRIADFNIPVPDRIRLIDPVGYYDFLVLEKQAALIFTDSGGVQEESCIFQVPCVTLREDTERPETILVGGNLLAGTSPEGIVAGANTMLGRSRDWANPFGDGDAAARMVDILLEVSRQER